MINRIVKALIELPKLFVTKKQGGYVEEWLVMKKSGIAHKFFIMGGGYRYAACGFETHVDKLSTEGEVKRCPRCLKSKGW